MPNPAPPKILKILLRFCSVLQNQQNRSKTQQNRSKTCQLPEGSEQNSYLPVCGYKYYNPANGTCPVSFQISHLVRGFVRFRCTKFSVSFDFFMVSLVSLVSLLKNRCRKSGFRAGVFRASYDMLSPKNFSAKASFSAT